MPHETSMSSASRKAWNLKVIQRHDPDILCIWDQVSYVMLMQYSSTGWAKTAVEGSLFLFDRRGLPRYGFFILNRAGSQNYMHLLTAEDNLEVQESYVIFRAKGNKDAPVLGLWASDPDHRKHLGVTLSGLHSHIKSGSAAPFYDPATAFGTTPAPTQPSTEPPAQVLASTSSPNYPASSSNSNPSNIGMQSLNDLFARLTSSASVNTASTPPVPDVPQPQPQPQTQPQKQLYPTSAPGPKSFGTPQSAPSSNGPLRGQALLDSLFAMASPVPAPAPVASHPTVPAANLPLGAPQGKPQPPVGPSAGNFGVTGPSQVQPTSPSTAPKGGDLLAQLFANINGTQAPSAPQPNTSHTRQPSTPPPVTTFPLDPAIIHTTTKFTPDPPRQDRDRRRNNGRRGGYATDTSPRPLHSHSHSNRLSVFDEDAVGHSRTASLTGDEALAHNASIRSKPRVGRALVPFQSDTGPEYHPDPTRPHVSSRHPAGLNGEEERVYALTGGVEEEEEEIFFDGRGGGKGVSPKRQKRKQRNGRGGAVNGNGNANGGGGGGGSGNGRNGDTVGLDRQMAGEVLMQGIEWDDGVVDKQLFLQSIYSLLGEQEFVDQLYNDYKIAQTRQASGV